MEIHKKSSSSIEDEDMDDKGLASSTGEIPVKKLRTQISKKFLGKFKLEKREREFDQDSDRKRETQCESNGSVKVKIHARSYRKWLSSRTTKAEIPDVLGKDASNDVEEVVAEDYCLSWSKKRRRMNCHSKSQCYSCIEKPYDKLNGVSLPKVVHAQECMVRSPSKAETAVSDIKNETPGGTESTSRLSMELSEEDSDNASGEESYLQTKYDSEHNGCALCMLGGELLCCFGKGCQRSYHLSCLDPPLINAPPGVWHCTWCVKKKMELGVHSVSKEVESVWDVREVASDHEEKERHKEYLVKYQGLAHVHNLWIPETKLLLEAPKLVAKFNRNRQVIRWKTEWTIPQRLLQKRRLSFSKHPDDEYCGNSDCHYEWLVKWMDLGYDQATWELENASFFTSPEAMKLIKDYENRHDKTGRTDYENYHDKAEGKPSLSQANEEGKANISTLHAYQSRKANFSRLLELFSGDTLGAYNRYLSYVSKLCDHWYKGQNAIIIDDQVDQERIVKVILFILSLLHIVWKPFLIISSADALSVWEVEFSRVAPSVNFIVYKGKKDVRSSIRSLEFYNEGGKIMFQVLLTTSSIVVEDLESLKSVEWRTIIIDECQRSSVSRYFKQFKMLAADMRFLISSQVKDSSAYYINMLSLLDSRVGELNSGNIEVQYAPDISKLKERLAPYTAYECKSDSFGYVEYWVPVQLSNVQLEQYCALLLSNPVLLYSCLKTDPADALRGIIISIRKCCDHPYLLDESLQSIVRKGLPIEEYLDAEIQVSGKLLLLDKILPVMKTQGLRVLIVFQSIGGSGQGSVGDILEDFVCQRFGKDCCVRIDGRSGIYTRKKKQAALNLFNSKDGGMFVFLIENRACLPSIKLSSVDTIILFNSDWDPQNDLKALHRISISSQFEKLKVFRLYSCCTVEEKVLIHAKKGESLENNVDSMNRNACHSLLSWGLSCLFNKVDEFHRCKILASGSNIYSEWSFLDDVRQELLDQLSCSQENNPSGYSFISKVQQEAGAYVGHISVIGEKEMHLMDTEPSSISLKNFLDGRHPQWHFLCDSSPRIRRKVNYVDNLPKESEVENYAVVKKSRNVVNNRGVSVYLNSRLKRKRNLIVKGKEHKDKKYGSYLVIDSSAMHPVADDITGIPEVNMAEFEQQNVQPGLLKNTRNSMKLEIKELCNVLKLPENVKATSLTFFDYIMDDFTVSWENAYTLQAFQISLCWTAAAFLKYKLDHKESLEIAKLHLKFGCKEGEVNCVYSKLQNAKKGFGRYVERINKIAKESNNAKNSKSTTSDQRDLEEGRLTIGFECQNLSNQLADMEEGEIPISSNPAKDSKSTIFDHQDVEEGEIHRESPSLSGSDKLLDLEDREITVCSNHTNNSISTKFHQQDLEEGEIPMSPERDGFLDGLVDLEEGEIPVSPQSQNLLDQRLSATMKQESPSEILDSYLKEKGDESNCRMEIPENNIETSQLTSRIMEELKAPEKPVTSVGSLCLSISELKVDSMQPVDMASMHVGSQNGIPNTILSSPNHCKTLMMVPSQASDFSPDEKEFCKTTGRIMEEQIKADEIVQVEEETEKPVTSLGSLCLSDSEFMVDNMQPTDIATMYGASGNGISETAPSSPSHCKNITMVPSQVSDFSPDENEFCKTTSGIMEEEIKADELVELEKATEKPVTSLGCDCLSDSKLKVDNMQPTDMVTRHVGSQKCIPETAPSSPKHCKTVPMASSQVSDFPPHEKKLCSSLVGTRTAAIVSKSLASTCSVQNNEVNCSDHGLEDGVPVVTSSEKQSPDRNLEIIDSFVRPDDPQHTIREVVMVDEPMDHSSDAFPIQKRSLVKEIANVSEVRQDTRAVTAVIDCDKVSDGVEAIVSKSLASTCSVQDNGVNRSLVMGRANVSEVRQDTRTVTAVIERVKESDRVEAIVSKSLASTCSVQNNEVNSSTHDLMDGTAVLTSLEIQTVNSAVRPSDPQSTFREVVMVDEPIDHSGHASFPIQKQSVVMGRANLSKVRQEPGDSRAVTRICAESPSLEFTGTNLSVVQLDTSDVHRNSIPLNQPPIPTVSSSVRDGLPDAPIFTGIQCHQSSGSYASDQEVQVSRQPLFGDPIQFANPCVQNLPLPPSRSMQMGGNETHVHEPRRRTNAQEFWSIATTLESINDRLLHANHVTPEIPQLACSDPLQIEMERIRKDDEQDFKKHEDMILRIKSERHKEMEEVIKKYDRLLQEADRALLQKRKDHRTNFLKVYVNKLLAEALMLKQKDCKGAMSPDGRQAIASALMDQLVQLSVRQQPTQMPSLIIGQGPVSPLVASSVEFINQPPQVLSSSSVRSCSGIGEFQNGHELHAQAPHLRASISQSLEPILHLPMLNNGVQNQHLR